MKHARVFPVMTTNRHSPPILPPPALATVPRRKFASSSLICCQAEGVCWAAELPTSGGGAADEGSVGVAEAIGNAEGLTTLRGRWQPRAAAPEQPRNGPERAPVPLGYD